MRQTDFFPVEHVMAEITKLARDRDVAHLAGVWAASEPSLRWQGAVATDGTILVATDRRLATNGCAPPVATILGEQPRWCARASVESLRAWCAGPLWPEPGRCTSCNGEAELECPICKGHGECPSCERSCDECIDGQIDCEHCEGTGRDERARVEARPGSLIEGITVDRVLLGRVLEAFANAAEVELLGSDGKSAVLVHAGGDVVAAVMPCMGPAAGAPLLVPQELR